jgi:hypothetical protein
MKYLITLMLAAGISAASAQTKTLRIVNESDLPVPFVGVYDSLNKLFLSSDSAGLVTLPEDKNLNLSISHVSFQPVDISLSPTEEDTTINIVLLYKTQQVGEVFISAPKKIKLGGKLYPAGNAGQKVNFYHHFSQEGNEKIGSIVDLDRHNPQSRYLRRILFELQKAKKLRNKNFVMEIKVFAIVQGRVQPDPINQLPIFVRSEDLKNKNEVIVKEDIQLPYEKILISFELPNLPGNKKAGFIFAGDTRHDRPSYYGGLNTIAGWAPNLLKYRQSTVPFTEHKYASLNIGIKYQLAENDLYNEQ